MTRLVIGVIVLCGVISGGSVFAGDSSVYHYTGRVLAIDDEKINIDNRQFYLTPNCTYERQSQRNRAYYVDKASARNLRVGNSVSVRVNGTVVDKIMIEEWKR